MTPTLEFRDAVLAAYPDVYTPAALAALEVLAPFIGDIPEADLKDLLARTYAPGGFAPSPAPTVPVGSSKKSPETLASPRDKSA